MKAVPALIVDMQLDLHGCEYHESQQLTHIDGFLVYYNGHGRLTLSEHLTDQEKVQGAQRLLDQLEHTVVREPQLYFWTSGDIGGASIGNRSSPRESSQPDPSADAHAMSSLAAGSSLSTALSQLVLMGSTRRQVFSLLQVPHAAIHTAVHTIINHAQVRRDMPQEEHTLVEEEAASGHYTSLTLKILNQPLWSLLVQITPPVPGQVRLTLGSHSFQAILTATGTAVLDGITPDLLLDAEGPDLELWLEQAVANEQG